MMRRPFVRAVLVVATSATPIALASGCEDATVPEPCSNIPEGGCPLSRGVACEDPSCIAVYACRPGNVWELDRTCSRVDAGDARAPSSPDASDAAADVAVDAPPGAFGGPGCGMLQAPDCSLGLALACGAGCCACEDLFVCAGGGWNLWGSCLSGTPVPTPK